MSYDARKLSVRPEGFEPPTLGFEGRSTDQPGAFAAERLGRLSPRFEALHEGRNPSGAAGFATGRVNLAPFRHRGGES